MLKFYNTTLLRRLLQQSRGHVRIILPLIQQRLLPQTISVLGVMGNFMRCAKERLTPQSPLQAGLLQHHRNIFFTK